MKGLPYSNSRGVAADAPVVRKTTIPVRAVALSVASITTGAGSGTVVLGDFPEGNILFLGASSYLRFSTTDADITSAVWEGDYGIGTTADADVTLSGTDINLTGTGTPAPIGPAVDKISPVTRAVGSTVTIFDNTDGALEVNLNVLVDAAHIGDGVTASFTVDGAVEIVYVVLGDD
jgi:hypothetical protein